MKLKRSVDKLMSYENSSNKSEEIKLEAKNQFLEELEFERERLNKEKIVINLKEDRKSRNRKAKRKKRSKGQNRPIKCIMKLVYIGIFIGITAPIVLFYGPYENTRKTFISTLLATRHAYYLTDNMSQETINKFMGIDSVKKEDSTESVKQNLDEIEIKETSGTEIVRYDIDNAKNYDGYILEIKNPKSIKVGITKYLGQYGQTTSEMAQDNNAIAAINGGSFDDYSTDGVKFSGTGGTPGGIVISDGKVIWPEGDSDIDKKENVVAFTREGKLIVGDHSLRELQELKVKEALTFRRPNVLINGKLQDEDKSGEINPRTVVGQKLDGTVVFLVIDGRKINKPGATLKDVQDIMIKQGVWNAGMLDGGYSTTMYYKGEVINSPNSWNGERKVVSTFYVE